MRTLVTLAMVAAMNLPTYGRASLNMSGTWELVREKSSPRTPRLCSPNAWIEGLKGEPCVQALPQLLIDEGLDRFTVTGAVPAMPGPEHVTPGSTVDPVTVTIADAFAPPGTIDRAVALAIRSTDAVVVRVFYPDEESPDIGYLPSRPQQRLEVRFTVDRSGNLTIDADDWQFPRATHQVYRRVR